MWIPFNETLNSTLSDDVELNTTLLDDLEVNTTLLNDLSVNITDLNSNQSDFTYEQTTSGFTSTLLQTLLDTTESDGSATTAWALTSEAPSTRGETTAGGMFLPTNATVAPGLTVLPTVDMPEEGLLSIHIYFIIVGVLFVLVIIMLGLHNYIEIMTDGGKKSLPAFGVSTGEKSKPRATLRPVVSKKPAASAKGGSGGKGGGKK